MNQFIVNAVLNAVAKQKWYQKNANTIVAGLVMLSAILSFVATLGLDLPAWAAAAIPVAVTSLGTVATKLTKNGVQQSMIPKLDEPPAGILDTLEAERARMFQTDGKHRLL